MRKGNSVKYLDSEDEDEAALIALDSDEEDDEAEKEVKERCH